MLPFLFCFNSRYPFFLATTGGVGLSTGSLLLALLLPSWAASVGSVLTATAADPNASTHARSRRRQQRLQLRKQYHLASSKAGNAKSRRGALVPEAKVNDTTNNSHSKGSSRSDEESSSSLDSIDSSTSRSDSDTESWNVVDKLKSSEAASTAESQRTLSKPYQSRHRGIRDSSSDDNGDESGDMDDDNCNHPKKGVRRWSRRHPPPPCSPLVTTHFLPAVVCALLALFLSTFSIEPSQGEGRKRRGGGGSAVVAIIVAVTILRGLHASTVRRSRLLLLIVSKY